MFEYDSNKSLINKEKHKICFDEAQKLWDDYDSIEVELKSETEPRFVKISLYNDKHWSAIFTKRGENIRLISVRRARKNEEEFYERQKNYR